MHATHAAFDTALEVPKENVPVGHEVPPVIICVVTVCETLTVYTPAPPLVPKTKDKIVVPLTTALPEAAAMS